MGNCLHCFCACGKAGHTMTETDTQQGKATHHKSVSNRREEEEKKRRGVL